MNNNMITCECGYEWTPRKPNPKCCPLCKRYLAKQKMIAEDLAMQSVSVDTLVRRYEAVIEQPAELEPAQMVEVEELTYELLED